MQLDFEAQFCPRFASSLQTASGIVSAHARHCKPKRTHTKSNICVMCQRDSRFRRLAAQQSKYQTGQRDVGICIDTMHCKVMQCKSCDASMSTCICISMVSMKARSWYCTHKAAATEDQGSTHGAAWRSFAEICCVLLCMALRVWCKPSQTGVDMGSQLVKDQGSACCSMFDVCKLTCCMSVSPHSQTIFTAFLNHCTSLR